MTVNHQVTLAARPQGFPTEDDFRLVESPLPTLEDGQFLVRAEYLSVDPYMRGRISEAKSYAEPVEIGAVMVGESVGTVIESRHANFPEGTVVAGMFGWQEYAASDGQGVRRIDPSRAPVSTALHVLGMPGLTAYFGLFDVCRPEQGNTVVVSAAAGAVGSTVGQLAKHHGCHVVGTAGSDEKIEFITDELGIDAGINYKTTENYYLALKERCPQGIDCYFDNVGGPMTDAVFPLLNVGARVAICGQISQYNNEKPEQGPRLFSLLIVKRATVQGFLVTDYLSRFREGMQALSEAYSAGGLKYRARITQGLDAAPRAFIEMMRGANIGKQLVHLSSD
ncbi:MAG: NADP-dependent oxidoreductase [Planctomycetota bacterium]